MHATSDRLGWLRASVALLYALALAWGLMRFGAAETQSLYGLFLLLSVAAFLAVAAQPLGRLIEPRFILLPVLGLLILGQVALRATLSGRGWTHLAVGWLALFLSLWIARQQGRWTRFLVLTMVLLGGIEALYGLMQAVGGIDYIGSYLRGRGDMATGTLINRNHFAFTLTLILALSLGALYALYEIRRRSERSRSESLAMTWTVLLSCSFMGVGVLLSLSRAGTLSLVLMLLFVALLLTLRRRTARRGPSSAIAWILLFTVVGLGGAIGLEALLERFGRLDQGLERIAVYKDTVRMVGDNPALGVGPGMYIWRFRPYQSSDSARLYDHAHNDFLQSVAEWGIPAAILIWAFVFRRFLKASRRFLASRDIRRRGLALGCAAAIFSVLLHSLVDFSLQLPALLALFATVLGLAWSLEIERPRPKLVAVDDVTKRGASKTTYAGDLVLRLLLVLMLLASGWTVTRELGALRSAAPQRGVAGLEKAVGIDPSNPEIQYVLGLAYRDLPGTGSTSQAVEHLGRATQLNPFHWRYQMELARAQELTGDLASARASLQESVRLNPRSGPYRWRLANFDLRQGDLDQAVEQVGQAIELDPRLRAPALALLLKMDADFSQIDAVWPDDRASRLALLRSLSSGKSESAPTLDSLESQWSRLDEQDPPLQLQEARPYLVHLMKRGESALAVERWLDVMSANGYQDSGFENRDTFVWNGDFEQDLTGAPLGWQLSSPSGYVAERVGDEGAASSAALRLDFDGSKNLNFSGLRQQIVVQPGEKYSLSYSIRTEGLTTNEGVYLEVLAANGGQPLYAGPKSLGSNGWEVFEADLEVPADTDALQIRLRRDKSQQIDSRLDGQIWIDNVRLERRG